MTTHELRQHLREDHDTISAAPHDEMQAMHWEYHATVAAGFEAGHLHPNLLPRDWNRNVARRMLDVITKEDRT